MHVTLPHPSGPKPVAPDSVAIGLQALGWIVSDMGRIDRLLALTGLDPAGLRARATEPALLTAALGYLEAHEPDLVACAAAIGQPPATLIRAREDLER